MFSHDQYRALRQGAGLLDRRSRGRLQLTGADRLAYLQGLLTNDVAVLTAGNGCYAALLTPQGRMISDMRVSELGDRLLIDLPSATAARVADHLATFIFSEDVEVRDVTREQAQFGLYGPAAASILAAALGASAEALEAMAIGANRSVAGSEDPALRVEVAGDSRRAGSEDLALQVEGHGDSCRAGSSDPANIRAIVIRSDDYGVPGFELIAAEGDAGRLADALRAAGAVSVSPETADVTRVEAGRPEFGVDMDEHTIPLEAGIEDRAISLTKGCYVGQEVIVRVLHRGQGRVARRLVGLLGTPGQPLERGMRLDLEGKAVGSITSAADSPRLGRPIALGYVHRDSAEAGRVLRAAAEHGGEAIVTVVTTPFAPPAAE